MTATKTPAFHKPPMFTRQQLIALLLPLIAEQALSVTIGLADTLMVSSVGEAAVSGVSLVDSFNTLMIQSTHSNGLAGAFHLMDHHGPDVDLILILGVNAAGDGAV